MKKPARIAFNKSNCHHRGYMKSGITALNRSYLNKIALFLMVGVLLLITIFAAILYFFIEDLVVRIEGESNRNLMNQVQYNVRFIGQTIKNSCEQLYLNSDVAYIMNFGTAEDEFEDGMIRMNLVWKSVKDSNPFIHSVFIYNHQNQRFYSTYNGMLFEDENLQRFIQDAKILPRMVPVFRKIEGRGVDTNSSESVMSYFVFDTFDRVSGMKNGLVVNVKLQWLLDNLNEVNLNTKDKKGRLMLMDSSGEFIEQNPNDPFISQLKAAFQQQTAIKDTKESAGFFTAIIESEKHLVSLYPLEKTGVTVFRTIPFREIQNYVFQLQRVMVAIFALFLLLAIIESLLISKHIYMPFGNMVDRIRTINGKQGGVENDRDEMSFLNSVYDKNTELLEKYRSRDRATLSIIRTYLLRSLLMDSSAVESTDRVELLNRNNIHLEEGFGYRVVLIKLDRYSDLMHQWKGEDGDLLKVILLNVGGELFARAYPNEGVAIEQDAVCFILSIDERDITGVVPALFQEMQDLLNRHYGFSISAAVSKTVHVISDLTHAYDEVIEALQYRYVYGRACLILPEQLSEIDDLEGQKQTDRMEKMVLEAVMTGEAPEVHKALRKAFSIMKTMRYEDILITQGQYLRALSQGIRELNQNRIEPLKLNMHNLYRMSAHAETMEDFLSLLIEKVGDALSDSREKMEDTRYSLLIEATDSLIRERYTQSTLCLDEIAERLSISSRQLSRIYKARTGRSIPEQIGEYRLTKAAEMLEQKTLSVGEIAFRVGIESETYFYSMFKKRYGTTPKEYASTRALKRN